ncbi:MAG TPA: transcriptional repressor [Spirochaetes bacterium]|nr:transcriptional repressor [Spirochaetota bacterium]
MLLLRIILKLNPVRRKSRQRERINDYIRASDSHPTALEVYEALRKEFLSLSVGNLYRNIGILVEEGRVRRRIFRDGVERFDAIIEPHYHFICERCGRITDFEMAPQQSIMKKARAMSKHTISDHTITFYGTCRKCGGKKS